MLLRIHPENPSPRKIQMVVECLNDGGVIIYPTDTVYGLGCDIFHQKAVERIARIKGIKKQKANFSFICYDLSQLSDFTKPINNDVFRLMKDKLPGPFTFILNANNKVPKLFQSNKKTVGIRIPRNAIASEIIKELGNPIVSTSVKDDDKILEYSTDPEAMHDRFKNVVDIVIDGGHGDNMASTVVDCTKNGIEIIREGKGEF